MPTLGNALDFAKYEARNIRGHQLGTAPSSPVTGQLYYNTADNTLYWWDGTTWVSARGGASATPPATTTTQGTIQLAGDLTGTATSPQIAAGVVVDADIAAANKDGVAGTPSMRTLGTGATQAAAGNDARFTDARTPTAHRTTHEPGGSDALTVDAAQATGSLRTIGTGAQQAMSGSRTLDNISPPLSTVNMNFQRIINVLNPTSGQDVANKQYVDNLSQGLDAKQSVRVATTANVTNLTNSCPMVVDGVTLNVGDRVLVKNQTTVAQNGIYAVSIVGTGNNGQWWRDTDTDTWNELVSAYCWVELGTTQADTGWLCTVDAGGTLETTAVTWVQFSGAGQITAGAGLTKTGNSLDVGAGAGITVAADTVGITTGGVTDAMLATAKSGYYSTATHGAGTTITITQATHLLRASRGLIVQCQVEATGAVILPDIAVAATGDVTITFGVSQSANTIRTTIVG